MHRSAVTSTVLGVLGHLRKNPHSSEAELEYVEHGVRIPAVLVQSLLVIHFTISWYRGDLLNILLLAMLTNEPPTKGRLYVPIIAIQIT